MIEAAVRKINLSRRQSAKQAKGNHRRTERSADFFRGVMGNTHDTPTVR